MENPFMQPDMQNSPYYTGNTSYFVETQKVLRNTYLLLAVTLIPTIVGGAIGTSFVDFRFMLSSPIIFTLVLMAVFYGWIALIERNKESSVGVMLLLGFTFFMGVLLGPLMQHTLGFRNGAQLVMMAAGGTAGVFFFLAALASNAKRDFSFMNKFIMVGFIVIMLAVVANIFLQLPVLQLALCGGFIILSSAIILVQINSIVRGGETNYVSATLTLYISIYNIFTSLLQILGFVGGERD
jgi:modulator of FtsH protease